MEDDYELSRIFSTFLKAKGLNVDTFLNAKEALHYFSSNMDSFYIVLTDFKMEEINGLDFAKEVRRLGGNSVTIIILTGYSIYDIATEEEIANIVNRVIMIPVSLKSLYNILLGYLESRSRG